MFPRCGFPLLSPPRPRGVLQVFSSAGCLFGCFLPSVLPRRLFWFVAPSRFPDYVAPLVCFPFAQAPIADHVAPIPHFRFLISCISPVMFPRRASLVALLRCSVFQGDSRSSSAGNVSPVFAASCIRRICCFVPCLLGYIAPLRLPGCFSVVLFLPRLPVLLPRCVLPIASPRCACSVITPFSYLALWALASNVRSCPPSFASG